MDLGIWLRGYKFQTQVCNLLACQCMLLNLLSSVLRHEDWWCFCSVKTWNETHLKHEIIPLALVTAVRHSLYEKKISMHKIIWLISIDIALPSRGKLGIKKKSAFSAWPHFYVNWNKRKKKQQQKHTNVDGRKCNIILQNILVVKCFMETNGSIIA